MSMSSTATDGERVVYVVLGDVVGSRAVEDRTALDRQLRAALRGVNEAHEARIGARFTPLKGVDEFGGTLTTPEAAYDVVRTIQEGLHPVVARYVITGGTVDVNPTATDIRLMDGPAFHRADGLLADLDAEGGHFVVEIGDPSLDDLATAAGDLALAVREGWTDRQAEVAAAYRQLGTQEAVADRFGVSQQAVSKTLQAAQYGRVQRAEGRLIRALRGAEPRSDLAVDRSTRDSGE